MELELKAELIDWSATAVRHHTQRFPSQGDWRVVRRGESVSVQVRFRGDSDEEKREVSATVRSAEVLPVYNSQSREVSFESTGANSADVQLPSDLPLGVYTVKLQVAVGSGDASESTAKSSLQQLLLEERLFVTANPWNREDEVFLSVEEERREYVQATQGLVYAGSKTGMPWRFGVYRENSVIAVATILAKCTDEDRQSIVRLTRRLTSLLNSEDNNGVLQGNWSGDYDGGTKPWVWQGSAAILEEYVVNGNQPVKFGQCWVFSGLYTSVLRILGIPCRSVTTFDSAHDTDYNRSIDKYFNEAGEPLEDMTNDSIWNFHVWSEAWMKRPDLPRGFDGWQALDATPQEYSKVGNERRDIYRMGPAPVKAVKYGLRCNYDTDFVIAEVNADIKEWMVKEGAEMELTSLKTRGVGSAIVTKEVGFNRTRDITNEYKFEDSSVAARAALRSSESVLDKHPISFEVVKPSQDELPAGAKVRIGVKMHNKTDRSQKLSLRVRASLCSYTGRTLKALPTVSKSIQLTKEADREVEFVVTPAQYVNEFKDKVLITFNVSSVMSARDDHDIKMCFSDTFSVSLEPPELRLSVMSEVGIGKTAAVHFVMNNPLRTTLTNVQFSAESDGLLKEPVNLDMGSLGSAEKLTGSFVIRGLEIGEQDLNLALSCDQLTGIRASQTVNVITGIPTMSLLSEDDELAINDVDFKLPENRLMHHTADYDDDDMLIFRRGQSVVVELELSQPVKKVNCAFQFTLQKRIRGEPAVGVLQVSNVPVNDKRVVTSVQLPADMIVGRYRLQVQVQTPSQHVASYASSEECIVLFNPWCKEDEVYMAEESDLQEYILNENGGIWVGSHRQNRPMRWDYGQFDTLSLQTALFLIERMPKQYRHQASMVVRYLSSSLNSNDNDGVLEGNWSGDYDDGTRPTDWIGSVQIFEKYMNSSRTPQKTPVKYGQCFIFSGIFTTAMRTLGIPSRSVTNFRSAHDTHFNRAVDRYVGADGKPKEEMNEDSIWNFHVWNDAWMARPDLPYGFGGWQAVDSTPQEESESVYCCGPASLKAIKMGHVLNYDVNFLIAEVNADRRTWIENSNGEFSLKRVELNHVGKSITTKAIGSMEGSDITHLYKFPEGSHEERTALGTNVIVGDLESKEEEADVVFDVDAHEARLGEVVVVDLSLRNNASEPRTFEYRVTASPLLYTGKGLMPPVYDSGMMTVVIPPGTGQTVSVNIKPESYMAGLKPNQQPWLECSFFGVTKETGRSNVHTDTVALSVPELEVSLVTPSEKNEVRLGQPVQLLVKGDLSLSVPTPLIHGASMSWHGRGLARNRVQRLAVLDRSQPFSAQITVIPTLLGARSLVVGLASPELVNVDGSIDLVVV